MKAIFCFLSLVLLVSCTKERLAVTNSKDYEIYMSNTRLIYGNGIETEINFWTERLDKLPGDEASIFKLASLYAQLFKETGIIDYILTSDSLLNGQLEKDEYNVGILQSLTANAIAQHQFQSAKKYISSAARIGDKRAASLLMLADVSMEIGDHFQASMILKDFKNKNSFAYLIREAKMKDHEGKLHTAIVLMEKAYDRVRGNNVLMEWTLTNLGDMYGHAGRVEDAYKAYLDALKINPSGDYPLKGIAWIALSNDHNAAEAKRIINHLAARKRMPEAHLLLAEVEAVGNNAARKLWHLKQFVEMVSVQKYKTMYNRYMAIIKAEDLNDPNGCIGIAEEEIAIRPTPESYDVKAWGFYHLNEYQQALEIAREHVEGQTFEPDAVYHLGMIYLANGDNVKAKRYLTEALESEFELGPSKGKQIRQVLTIFN